MPVCDLPSPSYSSCVPTQQNPKSDADSGSYRQHQVSANVDVCIGIKNWAGAAPQQAWVGQFEIPEEQVHDLRDEVEDVVRQARSGRGSPDYAIRDTRGRTSWGADSGEIVSVVLWISETASAALVGAATLKLLQRLAKRSRGDYIQTKMSRQEARSRAAWVVATHYARGASDSIDPVPQSEEDLTVIGETHDVEAGSWTVSLRDVVGAKYE